MCQITSTDRLLPNHQNLTCTGTAYVKLEGLVDKLKNLLLR